MSKTDLQLQAFLATSSYRSEMDWEMIRRFCEDKIPVKINAEINPKQGVTASEFIEWYERGFGAGDIADLDGKTVMIGKTSIKRSVIVGKFENDGVVISEVETPSEGLKTAERGAVNDFKMAMYRSRYQFSWKKLKIIAKYIPTHNDRVMFYNGAEEGIGVVKDVNLDTGDVVLYCYYIFNTGKCGYSMNERGICNLGDFVFESIDKTECKGDGRKSPLYCQRKLNRELEKHGKVWNQARHRVEPSNLQVEVGSRYWYISDKMKIVCDTERGNFTTRVRALAGNYFWSREMAEKMLAKFNDNICEYLAGDESNH